MVDAADLEKVEASKNELHSLIDKPQLHGIPVSIFITILTWMSTVWPKSSWVGSSGLLKILGYIWCNLDTLSTLRKITVIFFHCTQQLMSAAVCLYVFLSKGQNRFGKIVLSRVALSDSSYFQSVPCLLGFSQWPRYVSGTVLRHVRSVFLQVGRW